MKGPVARVRRRRTRVHTDSEPVPVRRDPCHPSTHRYRHLTDVAVVVVALWLSAPLTWVQADQINTPDQSYINVAVSGYSDGELYVRQPDGTMDSIPLADTVRLVIDTVGGMADFNEAERYFEQGQYPQAIARYERALRLAQGVWEPIILLRLVQACDAIGRLDRAGTYFMKVVQQSPKAAAAVVPTHLPKKRSNASRRLVERLHKAARQNPTNDQTVLFELFALAIARSTGQAGADRWTAQIARTDIPPEIATPRTYAIKTAALQHMLDLGKTDSVMVSIEAALKVCPLGIMPDLLLLKGQTLLGRQTDQQDLLQAGLCFMKVAIHFPDDPRAPRALFWAARVHDKLERPDKSAQLLSECLAHARIDADLQSQAQAELARIQAALAG